MRFEPWTSNWNFNSDCDQSIELVIPLYFDRQYKSYLQQQLLLVTEMVGENIKRMTIGGVSTIYATNAKRGWAFRRGWTYNIRVSTNGIILLQPWESRLNFSGMRIKNKSRRCFGKLKIQNNWRMGYIWAIDGWVFKMLESTRDENICRHLQFYVLIPIT